MKFGIIGNGFVGSAIVQGFTLHVDDILIYDADERKRTHTLREVVEQTQIIFICLPTPMKQNGKCDLSIIESVMSEVQSYGLDYKDHIFVIKSTVPPGTTEQLSFKFKDLAFVFNPEFLTERKARLDFINTNRIVLGGYKFWVDRVEKLYRIRFPYTKIIKTDLHTAELIKYMANCFFATKISFMNEMKQICEALDADWDSAIDGFISDGRIGNSHIDVPGHDGSLGFGGKCFPKDLNAMIVKSEELGVDPKVMKAVWKKNIEIRKNLDWLKIEGAVSK